MTLDDAARIAMGWVQQAVPDRTQEARNAVDDLLLALDLGFAQIEQARSLVEAQQIASHLRDALKEGWS